MRRHIQLWGSRTFAVVLLVIATQHWGMPLYKEYFTHKKTEVFVPTTKVLAGIFVVSFHEMGTLQAEKSVPVNSEAPGKIVTIIPEGTMVTAGTKLVELDTTDVLREVRDKQLAYQNALADVASAKSDLALLVQSDKTEVDEQQAQDHFDKTERDRSKADLEKQTRLANDKLVLVRR